ncbi:MAG: GGDEF domain-containing protein [gamma proteobacterium symbiont of Taylorina sp.]|nr:GGDEF domain-containing protein [gamma proteobacterium symbiont of Taylorina sp.]
MAHPTLSIVNSSKSADFSSQTSQARKVIDNLNTDKQFLLELSNKLHSTLDIKKLIILLDLEITPILNLDNVIYQAINDQKGINTKGRHAISYQLILHEQNLGGITLVRRRRFNKKEQKFIEKILVSILSPLSNSIDYQTAIQAAEHDPLTGVYNRFAMENSLQREIELAQRNQTPLSMIVLDVDFFKKVNDTYGHATGDCVLKHLTECIKDCARDSDMLFRYGGEEFMLLLNNTTREGTRHLADRIRQTIEETPCFCTGENISITASMGVSSFTKDDTRETFFARADKALYQAKDSGRNRVIFQD